MSSNNIEIFDAETQKLLDEFPEAKLTMRDRLPTALILTSSILTIQKSILNVKYTEEELREAIMGLVSMIPDEIRDPKFYQEIEESKVKIAIDVRPVFLESRASVEYCQEHGIPVIQEMVTFDYFRVYHACFNLLMRKHMLLKTENKEIMTGKKAEKTQQEYDEENAESNEPEQPES